MPYRQLILWALLALVAGSPHASDARSWSKLSPQERDALAPLASRWDGMPTQQRERLLIVARDYPKLSPEQQKRLHSRLRSWTQMTAEERQIARDNYKKIQAMPKQDQSSIRQQWLDSLCKEFGSPAPESPLPGH
jgi:hypothetical protein